MRSQVERLVARVYPKRPERGGRRLLIIDRDCESYIVNRTILGLGSCQRINHINLKESCLQFRRVKLPHDGWYMRTAIKHDACSIECQMLIGSKAILNTFVLVKPYSF